MKIVLDNKIKQIIRQIIWEEFSRKDLMDMEFYKLGIKIGRKEISKKEADNERDKIYQKYRKQID